MSSAALRCDLCGLPMESEPATGYCSERCLMWDFFGVPALKESDLVREIRANQKGSPRTEGVRGYEGLFSEGEERALAQVLGQLKLICDDIRDNE